MCPAVIDDEYSTMRSPQRICEEGESLMSTSSPHNDQPHNSYVVDADSPAELARLMHQDRLLTKALGLLPEQLDVPKIQSILDIGCGPGGWVVEAATRLPLVQVTGIDISGRMVA